MRKTIYIENVPYFRHVVHYQLTDGRRRQLVRWSPGHHWVYQEVGRELADRHGIENVKEKSCVITRS